MSAELRQLAAEATPGPWSWAHSRLTQTDGYDDITELRVECMSHCYGGTAHLDVTAADKAFIAAANPAAIIELLDRCEAAEREVAALRPLADAAQELRRTDRALHDYLTAVVDPQPRYTQQYIDRETAQSRLLAIARTRPADPVQDRSDT